MTGADHGLDVATPEGRLQAYVKLRASLDGDSVAWWYRGIQYGVVDLIPHRLWAVQGVQIVRFRRREDGSFENRFRDLMFYFDHDNGRLLKEFRNPFTSEIIQPPALRVGPMFLIHSPAGVAIKDAENIPPGLQTDWRADPAITNGDDLILHEEGCSRVEQGPMRVVLNDFITTQGSLDEVRRSTVINARSRYTYCSVMTWTPFMNMGDHPGHLMGRGNGRKLHSRSELDPSFLALVLEHEPAWLDDVSLAGD